ncbi:hypothetical protein CDEF62S_00163 [Castellaniella defragrans]
MKKIKSFLKQIPIIGPTARTIYRSTFPTSGEMFPGSSSYWDKRYSLGGNSGDGSYGKLATFKADILNEFVQRMGVQSVIEYGCGDGNQLRYSHYPSYLGFDVSAKALSLCKTKFSNDSTKSFMLMSDYRMETADLTLSLDVIYHLVEDDVFEKYMCRLLDSSKKFVIIYSSNSNEMSSVAHIRHRKFTDWIRENRSEWKLKEEIKNKYPPAKNTAEGSFANFYIFSRIAG